MSNPRTVDEIYDSLKGELENQIPKLTNFTETSFNFVWAQAFAEEFRGAELDNTAAYLEGFVEYAGGPVDEDDLRALDLDDDATPEEINERLEDANLDELVKIVGITRDAGQPSTGSVTFTTQSAFTTIPAGTSVGTQPDTDGDFLEYTTDEEVTAANGTTTVQADITAEDVGDEYNVGADTITYLPSPPSGVQSATNTSSTTGGEDRESNNDLRQRAQDAIFQTSGGGTVQGIIGYVRENVENVTEVSVDEFFTGDSWHGSYPHSHVIAVGGSDGDVLDAIAESRPAGIEHVLVRPSIYRIAVDTDLTGSDIDTAQVQDAVQEYLNNLELGDEMVYNKIIQQILNADDDITDVDVLDLSVENETVFFNEEIIDAFEDGDISILNRNWSGWTGDTGSFSAQTGTVISGSNSGELTAANANVAVTASNDSNSTTRHSETSVQIDTQTGNASDVVALEFATSGGTALGELEFRGNGNIVFSGSADTTITTWSVDTTYTPTLQFDFSNDQVDVTVDGSTSNDLGLTNSVSDWADLTFRNNTTASTSTVNAYIDDALVMEDVYNLGLGDEMDSDGITSVDGTLSGSAHTFTEDTDYEEVAQGSGDDSIRWILSGDRPQVTTGNTATIEFEVDRSEYPVDGALVDEGIEKVEDAGGTTYTEGTDWEEIDLSNDDRDDGIEWLGASEPANGADVTITYTASTDADVDYDITDDDVVLDEDEKIDAGTVTVTVL